MSPGFTNIIVLDNVDLHKVANILEEFPLIDTSIAVGPQQLATAILCFLFLPAYLPFLNPIEEFFGWLKQVVKRGTPYGTKDLFDLLQARIHTLSVNSLPPLALNQPVFPCCTKKGPKVLAKLLHLLGDLAHTVDERFVLAYPADPLALVALAWEETLVNLDIC
ncbi:hypothetical protein DSO57_1033705 [Entomophthora muscae]|uniref:Uncharacterized protein n=1 Tax=Entomophthora muscae TaxID=34485 RepID=A0ACC2TM46_9FUNG|nr:hypothetical protein DSO57_1033705 [Entomophthora muscae]